MAKILGTNVASAVVPFTTEDRYPTHFSKYGNGGWVEVADIAERDGIHRERRSLGMAVFVESVGKLFILRGGFTNEHWTEFVATKAETYKHIQGIADTVWTVVHNLGKYPSVTVVDTADNVIVGDVRYDSSNALTITFNCEVKGIAYLN